MGKPNRFDLAGKTCLITGGAGLLGRAFTKAASEHGACVAVLDVNQREGKKIARAYHGVSFYPCDITDADAIDQTIQDILEKYKRIDALVNNAYPRNENYGAGHDNVTYKNFCENVNLHLGGYFLITQKTALIMKKQRSGGNIVNIASIYGCAAPRFDLYKGTGLTTPVEYSAIKGAIVNLTRYWASLFGPQCIRVNAISPGGIYAKQPPSFVRRYEQKVVLGNRMARPEDIVGALIFLLSDASSYITGQNIVVDGGWSL